MKRILAWAVIVIVALWASAFFFMLGEDLSNWDTAADESGTRSFNTHSQPSDEHWEVVNSPLLAGTDLHFAARLNSLRVLRERIDSVR